MVHRPQVAVLGCGPAGLLVAWAAEQAGYEPQIISRKEKSIIPGSQHLQAPIKGVTSVYPKQPVLFVRLGTQKGYAEKVYGDPYHPCGWPRYNGVEPSWSVFEAYDLLWEHFKDDIFHTVITEDKLGAIIHNFEFTLSTLPMPQLCAKPELHGFSSVPYWIQSSITPEDDIHREVVVFNGLPFDHWYRWSILGRKTSIESTYPIVGGLEGKKAIDNNCDCWPGMVRLGRWAQWKHGVLLHHAYQQTLALLEGARVG